MPSSLFVPKRPPGLAQLQEWRDHVAHLWDVSAPTSAVETFTATSRSDHLGVALAGKVQVGAIHIDRSPTLIGRMGVDHLVMQYRISGNFHADADGTDLRVGGGDIYLLDQSRPLVGDTTAYCATTLLFPRALMATFIPDLDALHGAVLRSDSAAGAIARDHVRSLALNANRLTPEQGSDVVHATAALLAMGFAGAKRPEAARHAAKPAMLAAICRFIDANVEDPALDAESLTRRFAMSRSVLYRWFEPLGGVAAHIRHTRLQAAHRVLARPGAPVRLEELAQRLHLGSAANFSRAFTRQFGRTPGSVRAAVNGSAPSCRPADATALYNWTLALGQ